MNLKRYFSTVSLGFGGETFMSLPKEKAWFPAKTRGWGWGIPTKWQGWVVFLIYILALSIGLVISSIYNSSYFSIYLIIITALLFGICFWKGEDPRGRMDKKDKSIKEYLSIWKK